MPTVWAHSPLLGAPFLQASVSASALDLPPAADGLDEALSVVVVVVPRAEGVAKAGAPPSAVSCEVGAGSCVAQ